MLTVANLTKTYGTQVIFDNASFTVNPGEHVGLVGRNGSGKTTLLRLILGEEEPDSGTLTVPRNYRLGQLSQQISFTEKRVLAEACADLRADADGIDRTYTAKSILMGLGFEEEDFFRHPGDLSGGFQIRLSLARLLASEPDMLLLDEPTNYLDIVSIRWLTQFLSSWKHELVLITHDRAFMDSVTSHTMGIYRCKIRKIAGSTHKLYQQLLQEEEVHEQTRLNEEKKRKDLEQFINRFRAQATRARAVQSKIKALQKREKLEKIEQLKTLDFQFPSAPFSGKWLLEARDLTFSFDDSAAPLIRGLSFALGKRDRIGVIGKNGKGKTTLLNLLSGELLPLQGTITYHQNLKPAYFGQTNIDRLDPQKTVEEEILAVHPDSSRGAARNICGAMMFDGENALKKIGVLSGGEKSRVLLGKLLASPANLLLLDEPTNHLDMESIDSLVEAIDAFAGGIMIATHSELILHAIATRLIVFDGGTTTLFEGTYQDFLDRVGWQGEEARVKPATEVREPPKRGADRKDARRLRAEIIANRSRALTPLQQQIQRLEKTIMDLEEQVARDNQALLRASQMGEGRAVSTYSISIHDAKKKIEALFDELEVLSGEHHVRSKEYELMLGEVERSRAGDSGDANG